MEKRSATVRPPRSRAISALAKPALGGVNGWAASFHEKIIRTLGRATLVVMPLDPGVPPGAIWWRRQTLALAVIVAPAPNMRPPAGQNQPFVAASC